MATVAAVNSLGAFALNPRGNLWLNDDSTFGHKLLMKMGWSKGKGLGKNEDGIKENIKVKLKSTSSGLGFKDESFFKVQSTEYDSLLKDINKNCENYGEVVKASERVESLEQRSQTFRKRLHYRKLVRGKDLSKYSENDMKCIFILNKASQDNMEHRVEENSPSLKKDSKADEKFPTLMNSNTSHLSISDYFAQKMEEKKCITSKVADENLNLQSSYHIEKDASLPSTQTSPIGKKEISELSISNEDNTSVNTDRAQSLSEPTVARKKRKRSKDLSCDDANYYLMDRNQVLNRNNSSVPKKKKKSKIYDDECLSTEYIDLTENDVVCQKFTNHTNENSLSPENFVEITNGVESKVKKQKKSKKHKSNHFKTLKSCLKNKSGQYCVKNVSFNECVSYCLIESVCKVACDLSSKVHNANEQEGITINDKNEVQNCKEKDVSYSGEKEVDNANEQECITLIDENEVEICNKRDVSVSGENKVSDPCINGAAKKEDGFLLSKLPSRKSDYFNGWVESQRQALKMKNYKKMYKRIKTHEVLRSTNLLAIVGYGNWGY